MKLTRTRIILLAISGIAVAVVVALLLFSGPRMRNQPSLRAFEAPGMLPPDESVPYIPPTPGQTVAVAGSHAPSSSAGGEVYYNYYCVFCHGKNGKGNGPVGDSYMPRPADLTLDSIRNYSINKLYEVSFTGIGHSPVLEKVVPAEHKMPVVQYIKQGF